MGRIRSCGLAIALALAVPAGTVWAQALTGTKTVDPVAGDYLSIKAAADDLNAKGVGTGGVTFVINASNYVDAVTITASGTAANPILFKPNGNQIVYVGDAGTPGTTVITLNGADYVTLQGLNIRGTNHTGVLVTGNADNDTILDCTFEVSGSGYNGLLVTGAGNDGLKVSRTEFIGSSGAGWGMNFSDTGGSATISNNIVRGFYQGVNLVCSSNPYTLNVVFQHNTVRLDGGARMEGKTNLFLNYVTVDIRNNIFYNSGPNGNVCIYYFGVNMTSDFNLFGRPNGAWVGDSGSTGSVTLLDWRRNTGKDPNSLEADPGFISTTDLHLQATSAAVERGTNLGVTVDFDGETRPAGAGYDIGADEYTIDLSPPDSSITTSGYLNAAGYGGSIRGTAVDNPGGSGVDLVDITVQRTSDNQYWNGTGWGAAPTWLRATGTTNWTYAFTPVNGQTYNLQSRAIDRAGNLETTFGTSTFTYDTDEPNSAVTTSGTQNSSSYPGSVNGTATDAISGVQTVSITIRRTDTNLYWTGTGWSSSATWVVATGGAAWSYGFSPQNLVTYQIQSRATDRAGNVETTYGTSTFTYVISDPDSAVTTSGYYREATWTGIAGTATTTSGQTVTRVDITLRRASDSAYWNGSTWVVSLSWLRATGTTNWTYTAFSPEDGETYTVRSRATDSGGYVEATYGTGVFTYDTTLPAATISTGGFYNPMTYANRIEGAATDATSGITRVDVLVRRTSDDCYWDGTVWTPSASWITATGTITWTVPFPGTEDQTYIVQASATDGAGNVQIPYAVSTFTYDGTAPTVAITTVGWQTERTYSGAVEGTASDAASGVEVVELMIRRTVDDYYWNGTSWAPQRVWLMAHGTTVWAYGLAVEYDNTYVIEAIATDWAGNTQSAIVTSSFSMPPDGSRSGKGGCALSVSRAGPAWSLGFAWLLAIVLLGLRKKVER